MQVYTLYNVAVHIPVARIITRIYIPYSGYFSRGNNIIFVKVVILAISWKKFRGFGRAHAVCAFSCANISWFASRPRKLRKYYTVYI